MKEKRRGKGGERALRGEEELAVATTILLVVLDVDGLEALADGTSRLVSGKNTLTSSSDGALDRSKVAELKDNI